MRNIPSPAYAPRHFDPRDRQVGAWAFMLHRLSGPGLTFYRGLHLAVLTRLAQGPQVYSDFVASSQSPLIKIGGAILLAGPLFHGLNGIRLLRLKKRASKLRIPLSNIGDNS
jgi:succinate dehydrogenase cytochrome b556 subunit